MSAEKEAQEWFERESQRAWQREDVQEFQQVINAGGFFPKVTYRALAFDFFAECRITTPKGAQRRLVAVGWGRARALERLTAHVLEYHHPSGEFKNRRDAALHFEHQEEQP